MRRYAHLTQEKHFQIQALLKAKHLVTEIAHCHQSMWRHRHSGSCPPA